MNPSAIQLEVGKTYEVRDPTEAARRGYPTTVKILFELDRYCSHPFGGDNLFTYTRTGRENSKKSPLDLVKEV